MITFYQVTTRFDKAAQDASLEHLASSLTTFIKVGAGNAYEIGEKNVDNADPNRKLLHETTY